MICHHLMVKLAGLLPVVFGDQWGRGGQVQSAAPDRQETLQCPTGGTCEISRIVTSSSGWGKLGMWTAFNWMPI